MRARQRDYRRRASQRKRAAAGVPGLIPLYLARVTERISKKLRILKHGSGTVVGWDLHGKGFFLMPFWTKRRRFGDLLGAILSPRWLRRGSRRPSGGLQEGSGAEKK